MLEVFDCGVPTTERTFRLQSQFDGKCLGSRNMVLYGILIGGHILLDALTIFPPMFVLARLPLARAKKFNLIFLLVLGVFTMIFSAIRLYVFYQIMLDSFDLTWNATGVAFWGILESSLAAVIVSLPALNQFLKKHVKRVYHNSIGGSRENSNGSKPKSTGQGISIFERHQFFKGAGKFLSFSAGDTNRGPLSVSARGTTAVPEDNNAYLELGEFKPERQVTAIEVRKASDATTLDGHQRTANDSDPDIIRGFYISNNSSQEEQDDDFNEETLRVRDVQRPPRAAAARRPSSPTISGALNTSIGVNHH
ncbi:hypothetical protein AA313_de0203633 [Arthrobotrys entomopaga]|nr:hypothetical protein AA313_de0203633 [Arthrobotrys entomopaga]